MTSLEGLDLYGNKIDDEGCEHLAPAFAKMTSLEVLDLGNNKIDAKGKEMIKEAWKNAGKSGTLDI
jgi:Ran GTPase-activating protein (RanGAP) involved in mRNA processing and transport